MSLPYLSLTPHTPATIPSNLSLFVKAASQLLESFPSGWKQGKTHGSSVETFTRKKQKGKGVGNDAFWAARRSVHLSADYEVFKDSLLHHHAEHEHLYIPTTSLPPVILSTLPSTSSSSSSSPPSQTWLLNYSMPAPLNPRHFLILLIGEETVPGEEFFVVSIPWEPSSEEERKHADEGGKGVRGRYAAVERVRKRKEGGVEWVMATCSTPAGWVPQFLTDRSVAGEVAKDVPLFLEWVEKGRPGI